MQEPFGEPDIQLAALKLWIHKRVSSSDPIDYWDGNWLNVTAICESTGAVVRLSGNFIHLPELSAWMRDAERMHRTLKGRAALDCMEPGLIVELVAESLGRIQMTVNISPDPVTQDHSFRFEIDQSYLPALIEQCRAVLCTYPIVSKR
jgi:hypothetical protein